MSTFRYGFCFIALCLNNLVYTNMQQFIPFGLEDYLDILSVEPTKYYLKMLN